MIEVVLLLIVGVLLSAFFSGSETGLYRVNRVRLVLDGMDGDVISRSLLTLTNHPSMFVATVLVGNNLANYITSLAMVVGAQRFYGAESHWAQMLAPVVLAPLLFIYGELLPKNIFYDAPNRLLRRCGLPLLASAVLFLPITVLLWGLSKILQRLAGESPERVQLGLARKELRQVFEEGHEAGILRPAQRGLAQGLFAIADRPVTEFVIPQGRVALVQADTTKSEVIRLARRHRLTEIPVQDASQDHRWIGYYRAIDLYLDVSDKPQLRPLVDISHTSTHLAAIILLEGSRESLGRVHDDDGNTLGFVTVRQLSEPLFRGQ